MSTNLASLLKYWVGSMERLRIFEKWKVWKGFHGKEEGVVLSMNLKGFWIWTRSKLYTSPIVPSCGPSDSVGWWSTESGSSLLWEWTLRNFEKCQSWKECKIRKREVSSVWIWKGFEFWRGRVLGWGLMVESNVLQPCFPPQSLETRVDLLWKWSLWKFENHKVRKGWKGKEERVVLSMNLKGFWIWKRSSFGVRSYGRVQCPPTLLPSSSTEWLLWKVSLWKIWKSQSPKRTS